MPNHLGQPATNRRRVTRRLALVVGLVLLPPTVAACGDDDTPKATSSVETAVGAANLPRTDGPARTEVTAPPGRHQVATPVAAGVLEVRAEPDGAVTSTLQHPRLINGDPNAAVPLVLLVKSEQHGWLEVYLPVRPNGSTGWVRSSDVSVSRHDWRIEVALGEYRLTLFDGDDPVFEAPVAVAADNTPTPGGLYYTTELIRPVDAPDGVYGSYAFGLSGFSDTWQSFNGGPGQLGIHGTNEPDKIGTNVSNGCIRMRNEDIDRLVEEFGLPLGVPVIVDA